MRKNKELFQKFLDVIYKDGIKEVILTKENAPECAGFLNFRTYPEFVITFKDMVYFNGIEPLPIEECPDSFLEAVIKNAKKPE